MLTLAQIIACGIGPTAARAFELPLNETFERFEINTSARIAMFIAEARHESTDFTRLEESLYYSTPLRILQVFASHFTGLEHAAQYTKQPEKLANHVYAGRYGNGDEASGDGWNYRGRGLFGLTFFDNYKAAADAIGSPYELSPDLVSQPRHAALTAGWFWAKLHLNEAADNGDIDLATRRINPGMAGKDERRLAYTETKQALA